MFKYMRDSLIGIGERCDYLVQKFDDVLSSTRTSAYYKAKFEEEHDKVAKLQKQLDERNKEFNRLYDEVDRMGDALVSHNERLKKIEIAMGVRKE